MQVSANQIHQEPYVNYFLWDGEMIVSVKQHCGAHGFYSAAIIVERADDPLQVISYDGYNSDLDAECRVPLMLAWIAEQLTILSTGIMRNAGAVGNVQGLK